MPEPKPDYPTIVDGRGTAASLNLEPGATLAGRYRIVTNLGRGGMGEVFRADDLTLGVSVALKFLPQSLAADPVRLDRFKTEVRTARQVSHPNICRVYDLAEHGGRPFITMEYVDGEDLSSLLRRIGRLPHDKAVQIARQLCFGLAAAHEQGIIHRDLKPANIMLDGRGHVRIMDFGIAVGGASAGGAATFRAGTPGYMSPEQFAGKEVTPRSDLYALGLVLYEVFTGRPALDDVAVAEMSRSFGTGTGTRALTRPSQFTPDLDPAVERTILACLEVDAADRPASAIAVAAALPGGDPLAAALAAGETPSPELVAASGNSLAISPAWAWGTVAGVIVMLAVLIGITSWWSLLARVKPAKSHAVLADRAAEIVRELGAGEPADSASGMSARVPFIQKMNTDPKVTDRLPAMRTRPGPYEFWYRQSPLPIQPDSARQTVGFTDPFPVQSGEALVRTDGAGRLEVLVVVAPRKRSPEAPADVPEAVVARLFALAELDPGRFAPEEPTLRPLVPVDTLRSWTGTLAELPDMPIRVHLGITDGRPTYFSVAYPWTVARLEAEPAPARPSAMRYVTAGVVTLLIACVCVLALRNLRAGRGDRESAFRLSVAIFVLALLSTVLEQHGMPDLRSVLFQGTGVTFAVFCAVEAWLFYVAVEPHTRRVYPQALVSWTRLLRGSLTDPLVGRHVLIGLALGAACAMCTGIYAWVIRDYYWKLPYLALYGGTPAYLGGAESIASRVAYMFVSSLMLAAGSLLLIVIGQLIFRRRWAGYLVLLAVLAALEGEQLWLNPTEGWASVALAMIPLAAILPGGLLALVVAHFTTQCAMLLPVGVDWTHWLTAPALIPAAVLVGLAALAARAASAGRPISLASGL